MPEDQPWEQPSTVVVAAATRRPRIWIAAVVLLVAVAILKPWGADKPDRADGAPRGRPAITAGVAGPSPTADLSAKGLAEPICLGSGHWLVASVEWWRDRPAPNTGVPEPLFGLVRVWRTVEPAAIAAGPADPAIPSVRVSAFDVPSLGWCAPVVDASRLIQPATVSAWLIVSGLARPIQLDQVAPANGSTPFGALYGPPFRCDGPCPTLDDRFGPGSKSWAPGRYVFRYGRPDGFGEFWFAVELELTWRVPEPTTPASSGVH